MRSRIIYIICLVLSSFQGYSQQREMVNKKVYLYVKYRGNLTAKSSSPSADKINPKVANLLGDSRTIGMIPFDSRWSMDLNMKDLHAPTYYYLYNDVFLANGITRYSNDLAQMGVSKNNFIESVSLQLDSLVDSNKSYIVKESIGSVAKIWVLNAEWEVYTVKEKPDYLKGITPPNLIFKDYTIYLLKKVNTIKPWNALDKITSIKIIENGKLVSLNEK